MTLWRSASNWSEDRFRKSIPKMYSLNSEASIFPRRMSAAAKRWRSSWGRVSLLTWWRSLASSQSA